MKNEISHPPHYTSHPSGIECIAITRHMPYNTGVALAYIWRSPYKGTPITDLRKAIWHLEDEVKRLEFQQKDSVSTSKEPSR